MRSAEVLAAGEVVHDLADLTIDTTRGMHEAIAARNFTNVARGLGPVVAPVRWLHDRILAATYRSVHTGVTLGVRVATRLAAAATNDDAPSILDHERGSKAVGVLNGVFGDRLDAEDSPLALDLTLRHDGRDLAASPSALAEAYPDAGGRIAVFIPGMCETEAIWRYRAVDWHPGGPPTHGDRLRLDLGFAPLWLRYNSGRRVSANGADLDRLLEAVVEHWPEDVEEVALVGYSMGGLIARSAVHQAEVRDAAWVDRVHHVVGLGAPHHGAPLEKFGNAATTVMGWFEDTRPMATLLNRRSAGIKDLRFGNVTDADWVDHDPDLPWRDTRVDVALTDGIIYHAIGAKLGGRLGHLLGDLMVRPGSASGRGRHRILPFHRQSEVTGLNHLALRNHPAVYENLRAALAAA